MNQGMMSAGKVLANRRGIYGGYLNLRRQGTVTQLQEWITHYQKKMDEGKFCPIRGAKIIAHFEQVLAKKQK